MSSLRNIDQLKKDLESAARAAGSRKQFMEAVARQLHDRMLKYNCDGYVGPPVVDGAGKQICLRLHPAPILAQGVQQFRSQQDVAVTATLALANMNDHAFAVDIADLEVA